MISHKLSDNCRPIINQIIRLITIARLTRVNIPTIIKHFAKMNEYFRNFSMYWGNKHISCIDDDDVSVFVGWFVCLEFGLLQLDMPSSLQERLQWEFLPCLLFRFPTSWKLMNGLPTFRFCLDYALVEQFCSSFFNYPTILQWYYNDMILVWY